MEAQWRASVHTRLPEEGLFCSALMLGEPLPAYEVPPDVVRMRVEAEEAAAAAVGGGWGGGWDQGRWVGYGAVGVGEQTAERSGGARSRSC